MPYWPLKTNAQDSWKISETTRAMTRCPVPEDLSSECVILRSWPCLWACVWCWVKIVVLLWIDHCTAIQVKVKVSRNRPGVPQRVPGGLGSQISWHSAHEGGEVVSLTHRQPLPPGMFLVLIFIRGWVNPRAKVWSGVCHWKIRWHHGELIPGSSDY
jgi:hypothetical protein